MEPRTSQLTLPDATDPAMPRPTLAKITICSRRHAHPFGKPSLSAEDVMVSSRRNWELYVNHRRASTEAVGCVQCVQACRITHWHTLFQTTAIHNGLAPTA
jgi:hypothetical protein